MNTEAQVLPVRTPGRRHPELDGIRCLAVFGVMLVHFAPGLAAAPWGDWGVKAFFVLSGFLITDGLLEVRSRLSAGEITLGHAVLDFFLRRAARLWPLYLAVLAFTYFRDLGEARSLLGWNLAFATNHRITLSGCWPGIYSHFWTLAVEQQFYLVWPFLVLAVGRRLLPGILGILFLMAPILRGLEFTFLAAGNAVGNHPAGLLLPMCVDALAWGALLAHLRRTVPEWSSRAGRVGGILGPVLFFLLYLLHGFGPVRFEAPWVSAFAGTALGGASFLLIAHCVSGHDSLLKRGLRMRPLAYLGMISYGIYVLHNFTQWLGPALLRRLIGESQFSSESVHVLFLMALSVGLAVLSWHGFERPVLAWSRRVPRTPQGR